MKKSAKITDSNFCTFLEKKRRNINVINRCISEIWICIRIDPIILTALICLFTLLFLIRWSGLFSWFWIGPLSGNVTKGTALLNPARSAGKCFFNFYWLKKILNKNYLRKVTPLFLFFCQKSDKDGTFSDPLIINTRTWLQTIHKLLSMGDITPSDYKHCFFFILRFFQILEEKNVFDQKKSKKKKVFSAKCLPPPPTWHWRKHDQKWKHWLR